MFPAMWLPDTQARHSVHTSLRLLSCGSSTLGPCQVLSLVLVAVLTGGFAGSGSAVTLVFFQH